MSNLKDGLEEFKKTFESGAAPYNATPQRVDTMHRGPSSSHQELKVVQSKSPTEPQISLDHSRYNLVLTFANSDRA